LPFDRLLPTHTTSKTAETLPVTDMA